MRGYAPRVKLVAGLFDVRKPYFSTDEANVYTILGDVRHRGVELSLSGNLVDDLSIVAGAVLMEPRVAGEAVELGRVGRKPLGQFYTTGCGRPSQVRRAGRARPRSAFILQVDRLRSMDYRLCATIPSGPCADRLLRSRRRGACNARVSALSFQAGAHRTCGGPDCRG